MLLSWITACSLSRPFLFLLKCKLTRWTISLPRFSTLITKISFSAPIIFHARLSKINSTQLRCKRCNKDNNNFKLNNNNRLHPNKELLHHQPKVNNNRSDLDKLLHSNKLLHNNKLLWLLKSGVKWHPSNRTNSKLLNSNSKSHNNNNQQWLPIFGLKWHLSSKTHSKHSNNNKSSRYKLQLIDHDEIQELQMKEWENQRRFHQLERIILKCIWSGSKIFHLNFFHIKN